MKSLARYILDKNNFDNIAMIRIIHNGIYEDFTKWRVENQNLFFFDNSMKISHILFTADNIEEVDDNHAIVNPNNSRFCVGLELFYGGASL